MSRPDRDTAIARLVSRALTRPLNLLPGVGVAAAGIATGLWPLTLAGVGVYGVLAATTFFSKDEARAALGIGTRNEGAPPAPDLEAAPAVAFADPDVQRHYDQVLSEYTAVRETIRRSPVPLHEVEVETAGLMSDTESLCRRAQAISDYLRGVRAAHLLQERAATEQELLGAEGEIAEALRDTVEALTQQITTAEELSQRLRTFHVQMRQIASSLGAIRANTARLSIESQVDISPRLLSQVGEARTMVSALTQSLAASGQGA